MKDNLHLVFYKNNEHDHVLWVDNPEVRGEFLFTFDKKKIYNLFEDYPHNMTDDEKDIFDNENEDWKDFFSDRNK